MPDIIVGRDCGSRQLDQFGGTDGRSQQCTGLRKPGSYGTDGDGGDGIGRLDGARGGRVLNLRTYIAVLMVIGRGGVRREVAMNDRAFVVVCLLRLICVHVEKRPGGRIQLHAEAHEQDEAEPLHLMSIVADLATEGQGTYLERGPLAVSGPV